MSQSPMKMMEPTFNLNSHPLGSPLVGFGSKQQQQLLQPQQQLQDEEGHPDDRKYQKTMAFVVPHFWESLPTVSFPQVSSLPTSFQFIPSQQPPLQFRMLLQQLGLNNKTAINDSDGNDGYQNNNNNNNNDDNNNNNNNYPYNNFNNNNINNNNNNNDDDFDQKINNDNAFANEGIDDNNNNNFNNDNNDNNDNGDNTFINNNYYTYKNLKKTYKFNKNNMPLIFLPPASGSKTVSNESDAIGKSLKKDGTPKKKRGPKSKIAQKAITALLAAAGEIPKRVLKKRGRKRKVYTEKEKESMPELRMGISCRQCHSTETPEWRRGPDGPKTLCNACGLQYKKTLEDERKKKAAMGLVSPNTATLLVNLSCPVDNKQD